MKIKDSFMVGHRMIIYHDYQIDEGEDPGRHMYYIDVDTDGSISMSAKYGEDETTSGFPEDPPLPAAIAKEIAAFIAYSLSRVTDAVEVEE